MAQKLEEILERCLDDLRRGATVYQLLAAYPEHAIALEPALRSAEAVLSASYVPEPRQSARAAAMRRMLDSLATPQLAPALAGPPLASSSEPRGAGAALTASSALAANARTWFAAFQRRPMAFQAAALAGGIALFGAFGVGASAATGNTPDPVREIFGFSSSSQFRVALEGIVSDVDMDAGTLHVAAGNDVRMVRINSSTVLTRGNGVVALSDIEQGALVDVRGTLELDDSIVATRVHLRDPEEID